MNFLNGSIHHHDPQRKDENRLDGVLLGGRQHIPATLIGSDLTPADHANLDARWIDQELASRARLRRADSLTGGEVVGRKAVTTPASLSLIFTLAPIKFANTVCAATTRISSTTPSETPT